jgi:hypothetical protein
MNKFIEDFTASFAFENGLSFDTAHSLVHWMENEGVLDYDILKETYSEPQLLVANDA